MTNNESFPLIFVHKGETLPKYAIASINGAIQRSGLPVILLTNATNLSKVNSRILLVNFPDFYDTTKFERFKKRSQLDKDFRNGFWFLAAERLFILEQYIGLSGIKSFFHAELDVMVSNLQSLPKLFELRSEEVFIPRDAEDRAIASLIFIKTHSALSQLVEFCINNAAIGNEMKILAAFMDTYPKLCIGLPTASINCYTKGMASNWNSLSYKQINGFFDAAGIGQWLFGVDPRNVSGFSYNQFMNETWNGEPEKMRFKFSNSGMWISHSENQFEKSNLYCIHIHSKINHKIEADFGSKIITAVNQGKKSLISFNYTRVPQAFMNRVRNKLQKYK